MLTLGRPVEKQKPSKGLPDADRPAFCAFLFLATAAQAVEHFRNSDAPALPPLKPQPMTPERRKMETDRMPPVNTALNKGNVAWRQHPYGHSIRPDWPAFVTFASKYLHPLPNPN